MKTINAKNVEKLVEQFTLENLSTDRAVIIGIGWDNIKIDPDFKKDSIEQIVQLIGGSQKTKDRIKFIIRNTPIHAWYSSRIVFEPDRNRWAYISGQEYVQEIISIRNHLKK